MRIFVVFIICILFNTSTFRSSIFRPFIDQKDEALDASNGLVDRKGFLPIPLIITEPVVGFGIGTGLGILKSLMKKHVSIQQTSFG